ncbi:MAG: hypothetical protein HY606_15575, partial [Planctomycetes bacterium]|nr:hypothetical protein [Planctomycetota bacterium]
TTSSQLLVALLIQGDEVLHEMRKSSLQNPELSSFNYLSLVQITGECLQVLTDDERLGVFQDMLKYKSISLICKVFNLYIDDNKDSFNLIKDVQKAATIRRNIIQLIEENNVALIDTPRLAYVIHFWRKTTSVQHVKEWIDKVISNDLNFLKFVLDFIYEVRSTNQFGISKTRHEIDIGSISKYVEAKEVAGRLKSIESDRSVAQDNLWMLPVIQKAINNTRGFPNL